MRSAFYASSMAPPSVHCTHHTSSMKTLKNCPCEEKGMEKSCRDIVTLLTGPNQL